jgi:hypothetical protein
MLSALACCCCCSCPPVAWLVWPTAVTMAAPATFTTLAGALLLQTAECRCSRAKRGHMQLLSSCTRHQDASACIGSNCMHSHTLPYRRVLCQVNRYYTAAVAFASVSSNHSQQAVQLTRCLSSGATPFTALTVTRHNKLRRHKPTDICSNAGTTPNQQAGVRTVTRCDEVWVAKFDGGYLQVDCVGAIQLLEFWFVRLAEACAALSIRQRPKLHEVWVAQLQPGCWRSPAGGLR